MKMCDDGSHGSADPNYAPESENIREIAISPSQLPDLAPSQRDK